MFVMLRGSSGIDVSPDGFAGGWKPKGVELIVDGSTIFVDQGTDRWLEDKRVSDT